MRPDRSRVAIFNARFNPLTLSQATDAVFEHMRGGRRGWLSTVNVSYLMRMRDDRRLQSFVDRSAFVVADGQPLVWCAPLFGVRLPERVAGIDLADALCARAAAEGRRVYLLGATKRLISACAVNLRGRYPGLQIYHADGYFTAQQAADRADAVRASGASLLLVGMGVPRQERFIEEHWESLGVSMAIGVGGSFDVLAGDRSRASPWVQDISMEWFMRLAQEPRRLLVRYAVTNTQFCLLVARQMMARVSANVVARVMANFGGGR